MEKLLIIDESKCTACRLCELACSMKHEGEFNPVKSRISVAIFGEEDFYLPMTCMQCEEPFCAEMCPTNALVRDEKTGGMVLVEERCVGCRMCMMACPFGAISYTSGEKIVMLCDLCDGEPECVIFCPTGAITYEKLDTSAIAMRKKIAGRLRDTYKKEVQL